MAVRVTTHAAPTGGFRFCEARLPHLAGVADVLWHFAGPTTAARKRILPSATLELLVNLGDPYVAHERDGDRTLRCAWVAGVHTTAAVCSQPARQDVLGVRLRPAAAAAVLGVPVGTLAERTVALDDVLGREAGALAERCHAARSMEARLRVVADWVQDRVRKAHSVARPIVWATAEIVRRGGAVPIAELREETGFSKARLVGGFREHVGVSPKVYARLVRFRRVSELLQRGGMPLAEVALAAGYYDQPHMTSDFHALSGLTPTAFLAARHPVGDGSTARDAVG
ncbi:MAG: helix-turn-helix transcriptional regulator [bacterium]|nr:helix-turn-helix transcriptional regulator [bacterium]